MDGLDYIFSINLKKYFNKEFTNDIDYMLIKDGVIKGAKKIEYSYLQIVILKCVLGAIEDYFNIHHYFIKINIKEEELRAIYKKISETLDKSTYKEKEIEAFIKEYEINLDEIKVDVLSVFKS